MTSDDYTILGIQPNATKDEIKNAYQKLAKVHHPDRPQGNKEKFQEIQNAYENITSPKQQRTPVMFRPGNFHPTFMVVPGGFGVPGFHGFPNGNPQPSSNFRSTSINMIKRDGKTFRRITENINGMIRVMEQEIVVQSPS